MNSGPGGEDIWLLDLERGGLPTPFTFDAANDRSPIWSPDGSRVVFASNRGRAGPLRYDLYQKASSGTGSEDVLWADNLNKTPTNWSPDGRFILYTSTVTGAPGDVWILPLFGDRKPSPFLQTPFGEAQGQFSRDGRWIAYVSNESGRDQVYVAPFAGPGGAPGGKWPISANGGTQPRWRRDGKEIVFVSPADNTLMAAEVSARDSAFEVGAVKALVCDSPARDAAEQLSGVGRWPAISRQHGAGPSGDGDTDHSRRELDGRSEEVGARRLAAFNRQIRSRLIRVGRPSPLRVVHSDRG